MVIGASIRYGHFHPALVRFVKSTRRCSTNCPARFTRSIWLRVKPRSVRRRPTAIRASFTQLTVAASPVRGFAGALRYPRYRWYDRFMIRLIMKMTGGETDTRKEVVYTDWSQVASFARKSHI